MTASEITPRYNSSNITNHPIYNYHENGRAYSCCKNLAWCVFQCNIDRHDATLRINTKEQQFLLIKSLKDFNESVYDNWQQLNMLLLV